MSRISTRYAPHLVGLVALVSIPVYFHSGGRSFVDDCARPAGLYAEFDFDTPHPVKQVAERLNINRIQWIEGKLDLDELSETRLEFTVARSFRPTSLQQGFEKLEPGFIEPEEIEVRRLEIDGEQVEMRFLVARDNDPVRFGAYMTIYNHRATASPFREQMRTALRDLFSSLPPMTMYFLFAEVRLRDIDRVDARAEEWLANAWRQYRAACVE